MKIYQKLSKIVHFKITDTDQPTLNDFNWYFEIFSDFLSEHQISVFQNSSTNIKLVFVSEKELTDIFLEKMVSSLLNVNDISECDKYLDYLKICFNEATLNDQLIVKKDNIKLNKL